MKPNTQTEPKPAAGHTPGSWTVLQYPGERVPHIIGPNGESIAEIYTDPEGYYLRNAPLIAAAPDLLAACKAIVGIGKPPVGKADYIDLAQAVKLAQAAIARVEGRGE